PYRRRTYGSAGPPRAATPPLPQASADLRRLHSFPTRRSSDLGFSPVVLAAENDLIWAEGLIRGSAPDLAGAAELINKTRVTRGGDRKSTRLNSSHLGISYAVFCLKKKTPHPIGPIASQTSSSL